MHVGVCENGADVYGVPGSAYPAALKSISDRNNEPRPSHNPSAWRTAAVVSDLRDNFVKPSCSQAQSVRELK